ncbi:hypothetical protein niasHT_008075 [Heterodera trifolii]|uniref:Uncharacterized protein n=1 Tax=Heterodera trifolii TaxID=157864 RepID=A0ABD2LZV8_9BILA
MISCRRSPCCSSQNVPMCASASNRSSVRLSAIFPRMLSSSVGDKSHERPQIYQLEHIQKRLEYTVPLMFNARLDYTFYTKDVFVDNQILGSQLRSLEEFMHHISLITVAAQFYCTHIETQILNISPILEDGTVRLRWRVCYLGLLSMLNFRNFNRQYRLKNLKWYDGYSIFYVNGEGLVYKVTIQRTMPDDSLKLASLKDKTKEFVQRKVLPNPSPSCAGQHQQQQFTSANCASEWPPQQQRNDGRRKE